MWRAVHRLERHLLAFVGALDEEHVLAVVLPVARHLPQRLVENDRRLDFLVAGREQDAAHVIGQRVVQRRSLRQPERGARRPRVEDEQLLIAADLAMVALLRFLQTVEVLLQLLFRQERGAVDALHRLVAGVALPVRVGRAQQLERLDRPVDGTCGPTQKSTNVSRSLMLAGDLVWPSVFSSIN